MDFSKKDVNLLPLDIFLNKNVLLAKVRLNASILRAHLISCLSLQPNDSFKRVFAREEACCDVIEFLPRLTGLPLCRITFL